MFVFEAELSKPPVPHNQSQHNRKGFVFKTPQERSYIAELELLLRRKIYRDKTFKKFGEVAIKVDYIFGFPPSNSWTKKRKQQALNHEIYPVEHNKGDWDNLIKSAQDRLNSLIITDDCFIVDGRGIKIFTPKPYIKIVIQEMSEVKDDIWCQGWWKDLSKIW